MKTPLLDPKNYTVSRAWHDQWSIYQEIEGSFDDWHITRRIEWEKKDGTIRHDYMKIWKGDSDWYGVEVDANGKGWREPVNAYEVGFSGHGRIDLEKAQIKIDGLNIALAIAKELTARLTGDYLKAPELSEDQEKWTDLLTGIERQRGEVKSKESEKADK